MSNSWTVSKNGDVETVVVFENGKLFTADNSHPNYNAIVEAAKAGEETENLFSIRLTVQNKFKKLSDRVSIIGNDVCFDGDVIEGPLVNQLRNFIVLGLDVKPLVNFWENIAQNPNGQSKDQLFSWLAKNEFTIDEDGYILGYKAVNTDYSSINAGHGIVNDFEFAYDNLDNSVGNVVEIPRGEVDSNPGAACSTGLHVANFSYANSFRTSSSDGRGRLVTVLVNPRDVVSVPKDSSFQKMRVSKYVVVGEVEVELDKQLVASSKKSQLAKTQKRDSRGRFVKS